MSGYMFGNKKENDVVNFYYGRLKGLMEILDESDQELFMQFLYDYYMLDDDGREQVSVLLKCMVKQAKNRI